MPNFLFNKLDPVLGIPIKQWMAKVPPKPLLSKYLFYFPTLGCFWHLLFLCVDQSSLQGHFSSTQAGTCSASYSKVVGSMLSQAFILSQHTFILPLCWKDVIPRYRLLNWPFLSGLKNLFPFSFGLIIVPIYVACRFLYWLKQFLICHWQSAFWLHALRFTQEQPRAVGTLGIEQNSELPLL